MLLDTIPRKATQAGSLSSKEPKMLFPTANRLPPNMQISQLWLNLLTWHSQDKRHGFDGRLLQGQITNQHIILSPKVKGKQFKRGASLSPVLPYDRKGHH
uniref:Uncharacterized protein n=1 Tax=Opuntia streptacantha TaxID=393608 RepID=A0A7C8ZNL6_OPUST